MGKKSLIVGFRGVIGQAVAKLFEEKGRECIGTSSSVENGEGGLIPLDLTNLQSIETACESITEIDSVIFAGGYEPQQSLFETTAEHMSKMIDVHLTGPVWLLKHIGKKINKNGSIIFISSVASQKGSYDPLYSIVKGGVNSMVKTLARELAPDVRVNAIAPSLVEDSPVFHRMTDDFREGHLNNTLNKRLLKPEECADAISFLLENPHMNGQVIHINGGEYFGE